MSKTKESQELIAADLLKASHPLYKSFCKWVKDRAAEHGVTGDFSETPGQLQLTRRKARRFLTQYKQFRQNAA